MFFYSPANLGVVTPSNGLYREAPPKSGPFFKLKVWGRIGISLIEVYERVGKTVFLVCKEAQQD